jgi:hypothetical protein
MSFALQSHRQMGAACSQYYISDSAPVSLTLFSDQSYCDLNPIRNQSIKDSLINVGADFEKIKSMTFNNFVHTFNRENLQEIQINNDNLVNEILPFVNTAIEDQTNEKLTLKLDDLLQLQVRKAVDFSWMIPRRAYELSVTVPEKILKTAEQSGLSCRKFGSYTPPPEGYISVMPGVGQVVSSQEKNK